jgi:cytochrome c-type biogenesis protein
LFVALVVRSLSVSPLETAFVMGGYATTVGALLLGVTTAAAYGSQIAADVFARRVDRIVRLSGLLVAVAGARQLWVAFW